MKRGTDKGQGFISLPLRRPGSRLGSVERRSASCRSAGRTTHYGRSACTKRMRSARRAAAAAARFSFFPSGTLGSWLSRKCSPSLPPLPHLAPCMGGGVRLRPPHGEMVTAPRQRGDLLTARTHGWPHRYNWSQSAQWPLFLLSSSSLAGLSCSGCYCFSKRSSSS